MTTGKTFVRRRGTTPVPNATVHDGRLSYAALGLLAVLLARPDGAPQGYRDLMGRGLGKDATLRALRELTDAGYRHQVKRSGGRGALVTDTVISEEPITSEQAEEWLRKSPGMPGIRARKSAARTDLREHHVSAGGYVRGVSEPHGSGSDNPPHSPTGSKVTTSLRSESPEDPSACEHGRPGWQRCTDCPEDRFCDHGTQRRYAACALCKPRPAPWDLTPPTADTRSRAAGQHLED